MKTIQTNTILKDFKGEPLKNGEQDLTIGVAISHVLGGQVSNPTLGWIFGKKFATDKEVDLKAEDVVFLKKELEATKSWSAIVVGQVIEILEAKDESETGSVDKKSK